MEDLRLINITDKFLDHRRILYVKYLLNLHFPCELTHYVITLIIDANCKECFNKYGNCVSSSTYMFSFIHKSLTNSNGFYMLHRIEPIILAVGMCLKHLNLTLHCLIPDVLHKIMNSGIDPDYKEYYMEILLKITKDRAIDLLFERDYIGYTVLHRAVIALQPGTVGLIIKYAGDNASKLASTRDNFQRTALDVCPAINSWLDDTRKSNERIQILGMLRRFQ